MPPNPPSPPDWPPRSTVSASPRDGPQPTKAQVASYNKIAIMQYTVHFDDHEEQVRNPRTQLLTPSYHCAVLLAETW